MSEIVKRMLQCYRGILRSEYCYYRNELISMIPLVEGNENRDI